MHAILLSFHMNHMRSNDVVYSGGVFFNRTFGSVNYVPGSLMLRVGGNPYQLRRDIPPNVFCNIVGCCCSDTIRLSYPINRAGQPVLAGDDQSQVFRYACAYCSEARIKNPEPIEFITAKRNVAIEYTYGDRFINVISIQQNKKRRSTTYYMRTRLPDGIKCSCYELQNDGMLLLSFILRTSEGKIYGSEQIYASSNASTKECKVCEASIFCPDVQ